MINFKKVKDLTIIFLRDSYQNMDIIDMEKHKLNKKSVYTWLSIILCLTLAILSYKIIKFLVSHGQEEIFLNIYFLILAIVMLFQTVLVCTNIFYFSKDLELVLHFPIKSTELLIAKFCTLLYKLYISECLFAVIPISTYGLLTNTSVLFYFYELLIILIFPIFFALIVSIVMMFIMKISRFIKNKDLFQVIITLLLMIVILTMEYKILGGIFVNNQQVESVTEEQLMEKIQEFNVRIQESNKYFLVINPSIHILNQINIYGIFKIIKILIINILMFGLFILIGKLTYLKDILKNSSYLISSKNKKTNLEKKCKKRIRGKAYIIKEFKSLFRNPMFFMQCVYPVFVWLITLIIMSIIIVPKAQIVFANEEFRSSLGNISFNITVVYFILGILQLLFTMSPASLTAISREGKKAIFIKYIPMSFFRQFVYKGIPQIFINMLSIIVVFSIIYISIPSIGIKYILMMFLLAILLNILNSYTMLIIDLKRPKLEWDTEYAVLKQNNNKMFQYSFTIFIIILFMYLNKILKDIDLNISLYITGIIFLFFIFFINVFVKIKQDKIFNKIT